MHLGYLIAPALVRLRGRTTELLLIRTVLTDLSETPTELTVLLITVCTVLHVPPVALNGICLASPGLFMEVMFRWLVTLAVATILLLKYNMRLHP